MTTLQFYAVRSKEGGYLGVLQEWRNVAPEHAFLIRSCIEAQHKAQEGDSIVPVTVTFNEDEATQLR